MTQRRLFFSLNVIILGEPIVASSHSLGKLDKRHFMDTDGLLNTKFFKLDQAEDLEERVPPSIRPSRT